MRVTQNVCYACLSIVMITVAASASAYHSKKHSYRSNRMELTATNINYLDNPLFDIIEATLMPAIEPEPEPELGIEKEIEIEIEIETMTERVVDAESQTEPACVNNEKRPENQGACVQQSFGTLVSYPGDCTKFLVCDCEYPTVKACPAGLWFNSQTKNCDWPQNVQCDPSGTLPTTTSTTAAPTPTPITTTTDTTSELPTESSIPTETTMATTATTDTDTEPTAQPTTDVPITTTTTTELPTLTSTTRHPGNTSSCTAIPPPVGISHDLCQNEPDGRLYRYPYDCNAYIKCTNGCAIMQFCPPDKVFNGLLLICDLPDTAFCVEEPLPTPTPTPIPTQTPTSTPSTTPTTTEATQCEPIWGIDDDICATHTNRSSDFLPYPYNCSMYVSCKSACPLLSTCKPGTIFNPALSICDTPDAYECHELPYPPSTTTTATTPEWTSTASTLPPDIEADICVNRPSNSLLPYAGDCSKYILCSDQSAYLKSCPSGMLFNPQLLICDDPDDVNCYVPPTESTSTTPETTPTTPPISTTTPTSPPTTSTTTATTPTPTPTPTMPPITTPIYESCLTAPPNTSFPYPEDCQRYYYCWGNGTSSLLSCPADNWYNPETGNCGPEVSPTACQQPPPPSTTQSPEQVCRNSDIGSTHPIADNCQTYIYCLGPGAYVILNCPTGNFYNPATGNCGPEVSPTACRDSALATDLDRVQILHASPVPFAGQHSGSRSDSIVESDALDLCGTLPMAGYRIVPIYENCSRLLICTADAAVRMLECSTGAHYDPTVGDCHISTSEHACRNPNTAATTSIDTSIQDTPMICQSLGSGTKLPYPGNCSKFIVCSYPAPLAYACEPGLYFEEAQQRCVPATESTCLNGNATNPTTTTTTTTAVPTIPGHPCVGQQPGDTLPYPPDCQLFILCLDQNSYVIYSCNANEFYDPYRGHCSASVSPNACRDGTTTPGITSSPEPEPEPEPEPKPELGICAGKPLGYVVAYPNVCGKYIVCEAPIPVAYYCLDEHEFSELLQRCVEPELADCSIPLTTTTSSSSTSSSTSSSSTSSSTVSSSSVSTPPMTTTTASTTTTSSSEPPISPCSNAPDGQTFPYTPDCSKYILCLGGEEILLQCFPGTYYTIETGTCRSQTSETACRDTPPSDNSTTTTEYPPTTPNPPSNGICENQADEALVPYPGNCSKYIICRKPIPVAYDCPMGQQFDAMQLQCISAELAVCGDYPLTTSTVISTTTEQATTSTSTSTSTTHEPIEDICLNMPNGMIITNGNNCESYIICQNGESIVRACPSGTFYNPWAQQCDANATANACINQCAQLPDGQTLAYPPDCSKYIICLANEEVLLNCMPGNYYDALANRCSNTASATSCRPNESTTTNMPPSTTTAMSIVGNVCCELPQGTLLAYPNDTGRYIECEYPVPIVHACECGTHFDPAALACVADALLLPMPPHIHIESDSCAHQPSGTIIAYHGNCAHYQFCFGGHAYLLSCEHNWHFDPMRRQCVPAVSYQCPW